MLQSCSRLGTRGLRSDWKKGTNTSAAAAAALRKATGGTPSVTERENRRRGSETQAKAIRIGIGKVAAFAKQETEELRHKATKQTAAMVKRKGREDSQDSRKVKCSATSTSSASKADRTTTYTAEDKLAKLRTLLEERSLCAYLVPTDDPHLCEMPPAAFRRREYISGFTGSAGTAVVTTANALKDAKEEEDEKKTKEEEELEREGEGEGEGANGHASVMGIRERERQEQEQEGAALLWTDGRYFLQAETELRGSSWNLMKSGMPKVLEPVDWLASNLKPGSRVGLDPMVVTVSMARQYSETLAAMQCALVPVEENLVDEVWAHDGRPHFPNGKVRVHPMQYAGVDVKTKISKVREELEQEDANALLVNTLDEVAWLLNIRGADIENSPVVVAYVLVTEKETTLYIDQTKLSPEVNQHLDDAGVGVKAYDALKMDLEILCKDKESKIWIDPDQCTCGLFDLMCSTIQKNTDKRKTKSGKDVRVLKDEQGNEFLYNVENGVVLPKGSEEEGGLGREGHVEGNHETTSIRLNDDSGKFVESKSPISLAKATKNEKEIDGLVTAHHRDGVALCQFLEWLEIQVLEEGQSPTEFEISEKLCEMRSKQTGFIEPSFPTIAGEGANGAIIHYRPEEHSSNSLSPNSMLLLDSGGQFDCGTTDVTRTVHFGDPTVYQKECFTRVLKGHIALSTLVFPEGIPGFMVDSFARSSLWRGGLDYRHGTGHGVGAGLNVHEGPQGISARYSNTTGLKDGMVLSNEPGYYEDGSFGIRIENLVWVSDAKTEKTFGDKKYLQFNDLTLVPIQKKLILESMLTEEEKRWLNDYHALVWERLHSELSGSTKEWLKRQTTPI